MNTRPQRVYAHHVTSLKGKFLISSMVKQRGVKLVKITLHQTIMDLLASNQNVKTIKAQHKLVHVRNVMSTKEEFQTKSMVSP